MNTLSGFPVADRRRSWGGFKTLNKEDPLSPQTFSTSELINLIVSVEDTGVGIPFEAQSRVFTPFMQVGPSISRIHGGTGIGLSISKCLVSLMKGEIGFVSEPHIGSTFTFTAVFSSGHSNSDEYKKKQISKQPKFVSSEFQGLKALVVDSRLVRAKVTRYHFQRLGIHVEVASDLNQAISCLTSVTPTINMVLVEKEAWEKDTELSDLFVVELRKYENSDPLKLFILANSIISSKTSAAKSACYTPIVIMKPLRASMLAASLQRAMGVGNKRVFRNGGLHLQSLENLLHGRQILVVDDNKVNLKVAAGALKKYGAKVECVDSGKKAIELLEPPHQFDACFMDIQMPEIDGFEATKRIREKEHNINEHVIQATHEECLKYGMDGYVSKPFEDNGRWFSGMHCDARLLSVLPNRRPHGCQTGEELMCIAWVAVSDC
ncbi:Histidine kinase [Thalictrum thalictroides]|uniref:histidine kinase n=1 Tax=Thalictrum thalictroides TaxID=46969 RepID=A0A7J6VSJ0_THATH|nr:Histidine kinase [Thalictrum thalictroides]